MHLADEFVAMAGPDPCGRPDRAVPSPSAFRRGTCGSACRSRTGSRASSLVPSLAWGLGLDTVNCETVTCRASAPAAFEREVPVATGEIEPVFSRAARVVEAEYEWPFQSHASMGPACAVVDARADGAILWTGSQKPHFARDGVARALGLPQDKVHGIWVPGPGSYGRNDAGDAGIDAALLSKAVGRPVRVQGMRYEGHGWDPKGPASIHRARAALDGDGAVVGYVFESKGFSRIDIDTNESDPAYSLAGQLMGLPLKSLQGAEGIGVFIEPGFRRLRPRG
jgi:hypothetical protein